MLVDVRPKNATGKRAEAALGRANITCNKNGIPFDPEKPFVTSGVRLGNAGRHDARLRPGRIPGDRQADRRSGSARIAAVASRPSNESSCVSWSF
jgi:hypothetical protein